MTLSKKDYERGYVLHVGDQELLLELDDGSLSLTPEEARLLAVELLEGVDTSLRMKS